MSNKENAKKVSDAFKFYFDRKGYQTKVSELEHNFRLEVTNLKDTNILNISYKGKVWIQGQEGALKSELEDLVRKWTENPQEFVEGVVFKTKACNTTYVIILSELRKQIRETIKQYDDHEIIDKPKEDKEYRAYIKEADLNLTITQFTNGTLWLQGKEDKLFDAFCSVVEEIANPSDKEVVSRFISNDKEKVDYFTSKYTPELVTDAEKNVRNKIGDVYEYLEPYDRKYFVASECLVLSELTLPEYSAFVMPASKGFEGFTKKILVSIGLVDPSHFRNKKANFALLNDKNNPKRKAICDKSKYNEAYLEKISTQLDFCRNFMMHSDDSPVTKVETSAEAISKLNEIQKEVKDIFDYFKSIYSFCT